tara:strand:+ start:88 stop:2913 length:2826 start_codon:yes stop_codon:yes gene_type:complete
MINSTSSWTADYTNKWYYWGYPRIRESSNDYPLIDQMGILNVLDQKPPENAFRPPANWGKSSDPPIFTEEEDFSDHLFSYENDLNYRFYDDETPEFIIDTSINSIDSGVVESKLAFESSSTPNALWASSITLQRQYFPWSKTNRGYGGYWAYRNEWLAIQSFDERLTPEQRTKSRRNLTQQGIDAYGIWRYTGRWRVQTGYHGGGYTPALMFAWLVCGGGLDNPPELAEEMRKVLNIEKAGNLDLNSEIKAEDFPPGKLESDSHWWSHETDQRLKAEAWRLASNIDYSYEKPISVVLEPGTENVASHPNDNDPEFSLCGGCEPDEICCTNGVCQAIDSGCQAMEDIPRYYEYDQIIEIDCPRPFTEASSEYFKVWKNFNTMRNIVGTAKHPYWGAHTNTYNVRAGFFIGTLVEGPNGVGRVIGAAMKNPSGIQSNSQGDGDDKYYDGTMIRPYGTSSWRIDGPNSQEYYPSLKLYVKGFPLPDDQEEAENSPIKLRRASINEAEENKVIIDVITGRIGSTPSRARRQEYFYSIISYQILIGLMAKYLGGYENLPEISKIMYQSSLSNTTDPFSLHAYLNESTWTPFMANPKNSGGYGNFGSYYNMTLPDTPCLGDDDDCPGGCPENQICCYQGNGQYDCVNKTSNSPTRCPAYYYDADILKPMGCRQFPELDNLAGSLIRHLYGGNARPRPIHPGRKDSFPNEDLSQFTFPDYTWKKKSSDAEVEESDIYLVFTPRKLANGRNNFYNISGNTITGDGYIDIRDWLPSILQSKVGQDDNYAPPPESMPVYKRGTDDEISIYNLLRIRSNSDGDRGWSFYEGKYLYAWPLGKHKPFKLKMLTRDDLDSGDWSNFDGGQIVDSDGKQINDPNNPIDGDGLSDSTNSEYDGKSKYITYWIRVDENDNWVSGFWGDFVDGELKTMAHSFITEYSTWILTNTEMEHE